MSAVYIEGERIPKKKSDFILVKQQSGCHSFQSFLNCIRCWRNNSNVV